MYRSSPHTTSGASPAELLFGRKMRSKLPNLLNHRIESEARDRDSELKARGKTYADKRRKASNSCIGVGDKVFLRKQKRGKPDTTFDPNPFVVRERLGNAVVIERNGVSYRRNLTAVKKFCESESDPVSQNARPMKGD